MVVTAISLMSKQSKGALCTIGSNMASFSQPDLPVYSNSLADQI